MFDTKNTVKESFNPQYQRLLRHRGRRFFILPSLSTSGKVEVVAPKDAEEATISDFVHRRRRWIFTKRDEVEESAQKLLKTQPSLLLNSLES